MIGLQNVLQVLEETFSVRLDVSHLCIQFDVTDLSLLLILRSLYHLRLLLQVGRDSAQAFIPDLPHLNLQ